MKAIISKLVDIVSFFNNSHYWGGQLALVAEKRGVKRKLKTKGDTRWYSLATSAISVLAHKYVNDAISFILIA
jgi:hypothetical protein